MATLTEYSIVKLSLDIDDTISVDPTFFSTVSRRVHACGGDVQFVSSRSRDAIKQTRAEIDTYGIVYSSIFLLSSLSEAQLLCPHLELDWYQKHLWLKIGYAIENGITHVKHPGFRGGRLVKVNQLSLSSRRVAESSLPQPRLVEYTQWAPAIGGG
jgi:hypothetical protein